MLGVIRGDTRNLDHIPELRNIPYMTLGSQIWFRVYSFMKRYYPKP